MSEEVKKVITETIENDKWIISTATEIAKEYANSANAKYSEIDFVFFRMVHLLKTGELLR